jgi:hypothetical protein
VGRIVVVAQVRYVPKRFATRVVLHDEYGELVILPRHSTFDETVSALNAQGFETVEFEPAGWRGLPLLSGTTDLQIIRWARENGYLSPSE